MGGGRIIKTLRGTRCKGAVVAAACPIAVARTGCLVAHVRHSYWMVVHA